MLVVVRIKTIKKASKEVQRIFKQLRLRRLFTAVFLYMDERRQKQLRLIENFVTYGTASKRTVQALFYKRGHFNLNKERIALNTNEIVEKCFADKGVICLEDLVHEIHSHGEHFIALNKAV